MPDTETELDRMEGLATSDREREALGQVRRLLDVTPSTALEEKDLIEMATVVQKWLSPRPEQHLDEALANKLRAGDDMAEATLKLIAEVRRLRALSVPPIPKLPAT
jgi:hypothetical protein